jgi:uncharacterized protein YfdQ (DUF2303 family)
LTDDDRYENMMPDMTAAAIIRDLAHAGQETQVLEPGEIYSWLGPNGHIQLVDLTDDKYLSEPRRKKGTVHVTDVPSFAIYYQKHKTNGQSEIYANLKQYQVTGVLNAHAVNSASWQDHKIRLQLELTEPWQAWAGMNNVYVPQDQFANFVEDHLSDIAPGDVSAARLKELCEKFTATITAQFSSGTRARDGQTHFQYIESVDGKSGTAAIPDGFKLGIRPFDDSAHMIIGARIRYRIAERKQLRLAYVLDEPAKIVRDAMLGIIAKIKDTTGDDVLLGIAP